MCHTQRRRKEMKSGGGGAEKRGCAAAELGFPPAALKSFCKTHFPLVGKRFHSISCTVFYPKESLGNLKVTGR